MLLCIMFALFVVENLENAHSFSFETNFNALSNIEGGRQTSRMNIIS